MKNNKLLFLFIIPAFLIWQGCIGKIKPFKITRYEAAPDKVALKFIKSEDVENLKTYAFRKVAIVEFNVEYLVDLPDSVFLKLTDELYDIFVESIENNTDWQIVKKDKIAMSPVYKSLRKKSFAKGISSQKKGKVKSRVTTTIYPASGLGILSSAQGGRRRSSARGMSDALKEAGVLENVGATAALKVHTLVNYFRKDDKGYVVITPLVKGLPTSTKVEIYIGYTKNLTPIGGYTAPDGKKYSYEYKNFCSFKLSKPLNSYESLDVKKGTFVLEEFVFWTKEMFSIYSEMLAIAISENL